MTLIQCKMCGGETEVPLGASAVECKYCGEMLTLDPPKSRTGTAPASTDSTSADSEEGRKATLYAAGLAYMRPRVENIESYEAAIAAFGQIPGFKDADEQLRVCRDRIAALQAREEARRAKQRQQVEAVLAKRQKRTLRLKMLLCIGVPVLCACIAIGLVLQLAVFPAIKKQNFIDTYGQAVYDRFGVVEPGAYFELGKCEQDNTAANGEEEIEWLVLEFRDGRALVVSRYALIFLPYHTTAEDITWEHCSLRQWLNSDFISTVFSAEEAAMIPTVTVPADSVPGQITDSGNPTQDRIFLLSAVEAERYFSSDKERWGIFTQYAEEQNYLYFSPTNSGTCRWWLRTPGEQQDKATEVGTSGRIITYGRTVDSKTNGVRPAMWIEFSSLGKS
ncbi:MAG: hypothetical protein J6Q53_06010 [Oscillospiraceae bacterium]|nr:hypothetical protein [Oscillospiraceae bacterium]